MKRRVLLLGMIVLLVGMTVGCGMINKKEQEQHSSSDVKEKNVIAAAELFKDEPGSTVDEDAAGGDMYKLKLNGVEIDLGKYDYKDVINQCLDNGIPVVSYDYDFYRFYDRNGFVKRDGGINVDDRRNEFALEYMGMPKLGIPAQMDTDRKEKTINYILSGTEIHSFETANGITEANFYDRCDGPEFVRGSYRKDGQYQIFLANGEIVDPDTFRADASETLERWTDFLSSKENLEITRDEITKYFWVRGIDFIDYTTVQNRMREGDIDGIALELTIIETLLHQFEDGQIKNFGMISFGENEGELLTVTYYLCRQGTTEELETIDELLKGYANNDKSDTGIAENEVTSGVIEPDSAAFSMVADLKSLEAGNTFTFGSYEQDNDLSNGSEPIEWIILSKSEDKLLALSKHVLIGKSYNEKMEAITWAECSLRKWLNNEFYNEAFNNSEKSLILTTLTHTENTPGYDTYAGEDCLDNVFIPSFEDMVNPDYGFSNDEDLLDINRRSSPTPYAQAQGALIMADGRFHTTEGDPTVTYWTRTPGYFKSDCTQVWFDGSVDYIGNTVSLDWYGVRPAIYINMNP